MFLRRTDGVQFTTSLDYLLQGAYNAANKPGSPSPDWFELQRLALKADGDDDGGVLVADAVKKIVLKAQKASIKLPFIRRVVKDGLTITINNKKEKLSAGDAIICDIVSHFSPHQKGRDSYETILEGILS